MLKYLFQCFFILSFISINQAQTWSIRTVSTEGSKPSLTLDENLVPHIAYMLEANSGWVRYAKVNAGSIDVSTVATGYFYGPLDIAVDGQNQIYIAYHNHSYEDQVVDKGNGTDWEELRTRHSGHDGWDNSIVVDVQGNIHTSSIDPSGFGGQGLEYGRYNNGSWTVESVGSGPVMYANATSIALDPAGNPLISFYNDGDQVLQLAVRENGNWTIETIDDSQGAGLFSSIAIKPNGDIFISYYQIGGLVKLASCNDNEWSIETIDNLDDVVISFTGARNLTSIALYGDLIGISYSDLSVVKLALWKDFLIATEYIDTADDRPFGQITALAFDNLGAAHVVFSDLDGTAKNGNIYYARKEITTSTKDFDGDPTILYPNPVSNGQSLYFDSDNQTYDSFELYDLNGRTIQRGRFKNSVSKIDIQTEYQGLCILSLKKGPISRTQSLVIVDK